MIEPYTIKLLRECDAGIKMGVAFIDGVWIMYMMRYFKNIFQIVKMNTIS